MPSKSKKQAKMMTAVCKSPKFRQKVGISKKVGCDFHKADKGKYHEEINTYGRDRNGVNEMSDKQLDEKLRFGKAKEEITTGGAPDISRLMKMAGIQKQLDDDRENGKLDIRGILTGVASGDIDISEADARLQELAGISRKVSKESSEAEQDKPSLIQEIEQQLKERETHVDEEDREEIDEDTESYLAARDKAIKKAMGTDTDEDSGKDSDKDNEVDEDKEKVDESHWWNEGSNETERLRQLAGLKAEAFTEDVREEEVDEGKKRDVDGDGDIDSDDYLAAKDKAIKKAKAKDGYSDQKTFSDAKRRAFLARKEDINVNGLPAISEEEIERKYFRELDTFKKGSLSRYMAEMIVDEMKKGKTVKEISEELSFDVDEVSYIVEFTRERATEAKQVRGQWGIERASDKEDRLIARLDKKDTGDARIAKPKPRKRDKYDVLAAKHGLADSARR